MKNAFKRSKYGSTKVNGYDSKKEAKRAEILKQMEKNGYITDLREQVVFELLPSQQIIGYNGKEICGRRAMKYIADFTYFIKEDSIPIFIVEDCKGFRTTEYKRKKRLLEKIHGIVIKET